MRSLNKKSTHSTMKKTHCCIFKMFLFLAGFLLFSSTIYAEIRLPEAAHEYGFCKKQLHGTILSRTELFFGLSRSNGPNITEEEFQHFVDTEVTPHFPDGLTMLTGQGQFKDSTETIIQEKSKILILLYHFNSRASQNIEEIREAYKTQFQQESVLRIDDQSCASF